MSTDRSHSFINTNTVREYLDNLQIKLPVNTSNSRFNAIVTKIKGNFNFVLRKRQGKRPKGEKGN